MDIQSLLFDLAEPLRSRCGANLQVLSAEPQGGGCINTSYRLHTTECDFFVKLNHASQLAMFGAEAEALQQLAATGTVRVPGVVTYGVLHGSAYLLLEFIQMRSASADAQAQLGHQLAALHRIRQPYFGWGRDNTIGTTPQPNAASDDWVEFWRDRRLGTQLRLAARQRGTVALLRQAERLQERLPALLPQPVPALLHGDLWGGNHAMDAKGRPVIFDPACYYGDREADLAMTELFGGFAERFYAAYREAYPLSDGYAVRKRLYNLYHVLNHLNLFGAGYLRQAERLVDALLAEAG